MNVWLVVLLWYISGCVAAKNDTVEALICDSRDGAATIADMMYRVFTRTRQWRAPESLLASVSSKDVPPITVIMTTHNDGAYLEAALMSVFEQSYGNIRVLLVDDASSEPSARDTLVRLEKSRYASSGRLRVIRQRVSRGTFFAKNLALVEAQTDFVTFADADDVSHVDRIAVQYDALKRAPSKSVASTADYVRLRAPSCTVQQNRGETHRTAFQTFLFNRTRVLPRVGYFDSVRMSADAEFHDRLWRVFGGDAIVNTGQPHYFALIRSASLTNMGGVALTLNATTYADFLGPSRYEYTVQYTRWHASAPTGDLFMPFPLLQRRFPCPPTHRIDSMFERVNCTISASMATTAHRTSLRRAVESLATQVDRLYIYLNDFLAMPEWLERMPKVTVANAPRGDLRDNGKAFFLDQMRGFVFTCDDDIIYPPDYVQRMLLRLLYHDFGVIVGVHGINMTESFWSDARLGYYSPGARSVARFQDSRFEETPVDALGTGTTAWHSCALPTLSLSDFPIAGMMDIWLSAYAHRRQLPLLCVARQLGWLIDVPSKKSIYGTMSAVHGHGDFNQTSIMRETASADFIYDLRQCLH